MTPKNKEQTDVIHIQKKTWSGKMKTSTLLQLWQMRLSDVAQVDAFGSEINHQARKFYVTY